MAIVLTVSFTLSTSAQYINSRYDVREGEISFFGNTMLIMNNGKQDIIPIGRDSVILIDMRPVDLGLPSGNKWASCNIGANSPEEAGYYLSWGELEPKENYSYSTYKGIHADRNTSSLLPDYDAAAYQWGGRWVMPTRSDFYELISKCKWQWGRLNGVEGTIVRGPNGNYIFLPYTGYYNSYGFVSGLYGCYWTTGYYWTGSTGAYYLRFDKSETDVTWDGNYYYGRCIRPVFK